MSALTFGFNTRTTWYLNEKSTVSLFAFISPPYHLWAPSKLFFNTLTNVENYSYHYTYFYTTVTGTAIISWHSSASSTGIWHHGPCSLILVESGLHMSSCLCTYCSPLERSFPSFLHTEWLLLHYIHIHYFTSRPSNLDFQVLLDVSLLCFCISLAFL